MTAFLGMGAIVWVAAPRAAAAVSPEGSFPAPTDLEPFVIARNLAELGPRFVGSESHREAVLLLVDWMRRAGLQEVEAIDVADREGLLNLTGVLPGTSGLEIHLTAHYDSVAGSPGAVDNASGCAVALAAVARLAATPRRHTLRLILFDGEETGLFGSRAWVAAMSQEARSTLLASLNLEMLGWRGAPGAVVGSLPTGALSQRPWRQAPAWLVGRALTGLAGAGLPAEYQDSRNPLLVQMLYRTVRIPYGTDSDPYLAAGLPAVFLADLSFGEIYPEYHRPEDRPDLLDPQRMRRWVEGVAGAVQELDALQRPPEAADRFLVAGRWIVPFSLIQGLGFGLWILLLLAAWRRRPKSGEVLAGEAGCLPVTAVWLLLFPFAVAALPLLAPALLCPGAVATLLPSRSRLGRSLRVAMVWLPATAFFFYLLEAVDDGLVKGMALGGGELALLCGGLVAATAQVLVTTERLDDTPPQWGLEG